MGYGRFQPVKCNIMQLTKKHNKIQASYTLEGTVLENVEIIKYLGVMHQSFVSTAPHVRGWAGIMIFHFSEPWYKPCTAGTADGYNPALSPTLHNRKFHRGKVLNVKAPAIPWHCGDNQKVIALHLSPAIPRLSP